MSDVLASARQYLARLANFPGRHDSIDQIVALADALAAAEAERDALRATVETLQTRLQGIEDRTVAGVRDTLWEPPP